MTHTPGPWKVDENGVIMGGKDWTTSIAETYLVAWLKCQQDQPVGFSERCIDEAIANGDLIAAAPDLLAVVKDAHTMLGEYLIEMNQQEGAVNELHTRLWAVIAKAEGSHD